MEEKGPQRSKIEPIGSKMKPQRSKIGPKEPLWYPRCTKKKPQRSKIKPIGFKMSPKGRKLNSKSLYGTLDGRKRTPKIKN